MDTQHFPHFQRPWSLLLASLLTVGVTGTVWAGDGDGERIRVEKKVIHEPCLKVSGTGEAPFGTAVRKRAFLGVELTALTPELRSHFGVPEDVGVMVSRVVDDSAAFRAGLAVGDILSRVDGDEVDGPWKLTSVIRDKKGGEVVDLDYWRDGKLSQVSVTLDEKEGCVFDLGSTVHRIEELGRHLPEIQMQGLQISEEAMAEAMEALQNVDWERHLQQLENLEIDVDMDVQMEALHEQMKELEIRLQKETKHLEKELKIEMKERERELREEHKERIREEQAVREEMIRAQHEARRAMEEARREQHEALRQAHEAEREAEQEQRRAAEETRREAEHEARQAAEEARREAEEAAREAAEEGDGKLLI